MKRTNSCVYKAPGRLMILAGFALLGAAACARSMQDLSMPMELFSFESESQEKPAAPVLAPTLPSETEEPAMKAVKITIAYNNVGLNPGLETDWGFSAFVEIGDEVVLFDTGTDGEILLRNMEKLGLDPARVDYMVLSHLHNDHIGGSAAVLATGVRPAVYVLDNFPPGYKTRMNDITQVVVVEQPLEITDSVYTTGPVSGEITEQALVLETAEGLVVITGCAHPGANRMVAAAREAVEGQVHLVLGGFHLGSASAAAVETIIADFRDMGVQNAAPSHCTGNAAMARFEQAYGDHYLSSGLGAVIEIP